MRTGLVLSGGGARGLSHVGVLKALGELGVVPDAISGTSAGALVGALFACGLSPVEILEKVKKQTFFSPANFDFNGGGFFKVKSLKEFVSENMKCRKFDELGIKLFITATNIETGEYRIFSEGDLILPVIASAAVPAMFNPVTIEGHLYLDGGILNNFPIEPLLNQYDVIIGSNASHWPEMHKKWDRRSIIQRSFQLAINSGITEKIRECDILIDPPVGHYLPFSKSRIGELMEIGYAATMEQKDRIKELYKS